VGVDLKPGFVTLLDDELVAELERASQAQDGENQTADATGSEQAGAASRSTYYRRDRNFSLTVADLALTGIATAEEDLWLPVERPSGRLPWEAKDPSVLAGVRGSNVTGVVGRQGLEP
jgi:hypothetical protein